MILRGGLVDVVYSVLVVEYESKTVEIKQKIVSNLIVNLNEEKLCITEFPENVSHFMTE